MFAVSKTISGLYGPEPVKEHEVVPLKFAFNLWADMSLSVLAKKVFSRLHRKKLTFCHLKRTCLFDKGRNAKAELGCWVSKLRPVG